jgi:hypothetical protein
VSGDRRAEEVGVATLQLRSTLLRAGCCSAIVLSGCGGGSVEDGSVADVYGAAVRWLVEEVGDADRPDPERVFLEATGEDAIPLEVQVEVINRLEDDMAVRFIDTREEAVEASEPGDPIRDAGVLIGLGPVTDIDRPPVRLHVDRYRNVRDVVAYELVLERRAGDWQVAGEPEPLPVPDEDLGLDT